MTSSVLWSVLWGQTQDAESNWAGRGKRNMSFILSVTDLFLFVFLFFSLSFILSVLICFFFFLPFHLFSVFFSFFLPVSVSVSLFVSLSLFVSSLSIFSSACFYFSLYFLSTLCLCWFFFFYRLPGCKTPYSFSNFTFLPFWFPFFPFGHQTHISLNLFFLFFYRSPD